jgi:hypothetical protein
MRGPLDREPESRSSDDERLFFQPGTHGGTDFGPALAAAMEAFQVQFPARTWNRYIFVIDDEADPKFALDALPEGCIPLTRACALQIVSLDELPYALDALLDPKHGEPT